MPLSPPTSLELRVRYPVFEGVEESTLLAVLAETSGMVDETWIEADRKPAMLAYAAHVLTAEGFGRQSMTIGESDIKVAGPLTSAQVGDVKVSFAGGSGSSSGAGGSGGDLSTTIYGQRYLALLRRNHPAVLVA